MLEKPFISTFLYLRIMPLSFWPLLILANDQLVFGSNKATPHKIHYTHHTHPSFIFKLKYPQVSGPCLKNKHKIRLSGSPVEIKIKLKTP
jgi:hypothetical protein